MQPINRNLVFSTANNLFSEIYADKKSLLKNPTSEQLKKLVSEAKKEAFRLAWSYMLQTVAILNDSKSAVTMFAAAWAMSKTASEVRAKLFEAYSTGVPFEFKFRKSNGEVRVARGEALVAGGNYEPKGTRKRKPRKNQTAVRYYDFDKGTIRSFRLDSIIVN